MFTPDQNSPRAATPCAENEDRILDLVHGSLDESDRGRIEAHLALCPACRSFAQELQALDAALRLKFEGKELPASFKRTLLSQIDAETARRAPDRVSLRRAAIESEFRQQSAGLLKRVVRERWGSFLDSLGVVTLAFVVVLILQRVPVRGSTLAQALAHVGAVPLLWITAATFFLGALWFGLREQIRRVVG